MNMEEYQKLLEEVYNKNLKSFKKYAPALYQRMILENDDSYSLEIAQNGDLNIAKDGKPIYPYENVKEYFDTYLDTYYQRRKNNIVPYQVDNSMLDISEEFFDAHMSSNKYSVKLGHKYYEIFNEAPLKSLDIEPVFSDTNRYCMLLFGVGLGYHIPKLLKKYKIKHLVLFEENFEMLKASLYTIDWEEILIYFTQTDKHRSLEIVIDDDAVKMDKMFIGYLQTKIPLAYYDMWYFISYDNPIFKELISLIQKNIHLYTHIGLGFYDDEKWSLRHTLHNLDSKIPLLKKTKYEVDNDKHLFIIGNGPSLDEYIDVIKEHRDKSIVVAAGTALGSLYKNGIKPDFVVEIERTIGTYHSLTTKVPKEFLKDIIFICMNNIHPRVLTLFKKAYMFNKFNDTGSAFIQDSKHVHLSYSNPLVGNGVLAIMLFLGFRNISLFGMDFGFKSKNKHHSKDSIYYDEETNFEYSSDKFIEVKGVDNKVVYTDKTYNDGRNLFEELLSIYKRHKMKVTVYNFSNGAYIKGTICANKNNKFLERLQNLTKSEKDRLLYTIDKQFVISMQSTSIDKKRLENSLLKIKKELLGYQDKVSDCKIYLDAINICYVNFLKEFKNDPYVINMLKGTFIALLAKVYFYINCKTQDEKVSKFIKESIAIIADFFDIVIQDIELLGNIIDTPFHRKLS